MKKKLVSLLSLILVAVMVFPVGVFADGAVTLYFNATTEKGKKTYQIDASAFTGDDAIVKWTSTDESVVTVSDKGLVTAVGEGSAYISGYDAKNDQKINQEFKSISRTLKSIAVDTTSKFEKKYYTGDVFDPTGMVIKATYDNGDVDSISTGYTYTPSGALNTSISEIEIAYKDGNSEKKCKQAIEVTELYVTKVQIINYAKEYVEGDTIKDVRIKVTYNDETTEEKESGFTISNTAALKTTDTSFTATYRGVTSDSVTITVKEKPSETEKPSTGSVISYTIEMTTAPTKKTYKVGDLFDDSGMKVKVYQIKTPVGGGNSMKTDYSSEVSGLTYTTYKIKDTDAGKDYIEFEISFNADGKTETATLKVTGLTIGNAVDESRIAEITAVALKEDKYPEGYKFSLSDIAKMKVKFVGESKAVTLDDDEFSDYEYISSEFMALEVYDDEGERKTYSSKRDTIRDDDIITEANGDKTVNMALRYTYFTSNSSTAKSKEGEYMFKIEIGEADVSYYYDSKLIAEYDDLEDALEYCNEQDEDIDEDDFDISDVDDDEYILLKLGKSFDITSFEFTPENNIIIDLNGYNLTMDSDIFEFDKKEDFTVIIRNTASVDSKLTYDDKDIVIVLKEGEKVEFEYNKALPGIYTVTASFNTEEGTVTADPKLSTGKVEVGKGGTVKFTVTPKADYAVDTVKVGSKSVVNEKDNYSLNSSTGVVTYTLKDVSKDTTFSVTFKKVKKAWVNPFRDVSENAEYYSAVEFVYENELFKGTTTSTFSPSGSMTRATFVTVLGRLSGMTDEEAVRKYGYDSDFTDVSASNSRITYAVPYIKWAVENGIVEGYGDGTFGPENEITHQQMYVMMYRYARFVENKSDSVQYTSLSMSDRSSVANWAVDGVKYAQKNDYLVFTNSTQTKIDPTGVAKRSELAMLLEDFCANVLNWSGSNK